MQEQQEPDLSATVQEQQEVETLPAVQSEFIYPSSGNTAEDLIGGALNVISDGVTASEVGNYTVTVVCETKDTIYSGLADYTINPKPISNVDLHLDEDSFTYNGGGQKPNITFKMNSTDLTENDDYTVTYPTDMTSVEIKVIIIEGIGNFNGEKTVNYQINEATVKVKPKDISKIYGKTPVFALESQSPLTTEAELKTLANSATFESEGAELTAHVNENGYVISVRLTSNPNSGLNPNLIFEVDGTGILTVEKADLTVAINSVIGVMLILLKKDLIFSDKCGILF